MTTPIWHWAAFNLFILCLIALDLGVFQRKSHAVSAREAAGWSAFWIALSLLFNAGLWYFRGEEAALAFLTGYLIEKTLSVDNLFVFVLIFSAFKTPPALQHRVLVWGVLGALVMRGLLIGAGAALLHQFHWIIYLFGGFLVVAGVRMALHRDQTVDPKSSALVRGLRRFLPVTEEYQGSSFLVRQAGKLAATPLLVVLLVVETTDLVFAVDSIPAIFSVTQDPFLVYTSNVFAILGLRSLYFLLAGVLDKFHYLTLGLSAVLVFVGLKMAASDLYHVPIALSLGVIALIIGIAIAASLWYTRQQKTLLQSR